MANYRIFRPVLMAILAMEFVGGSHLRGGIISWRAMNTTPSGTSAVVLIHTRLSWRRDFWSPSCSNSDITSQLVVLTGNGDVTCTTGNCSEFASSGGPIVTDTSCTDFSAVIDYSSGERYDRRTLAINSSMTIGFYGGNWYQLAIGGKGNWQLTCKIDLTVRADGVLNTSPVTTTLPVIYRQINVYHTHIIQMSDADSTDTLRCRWATNNSAPNTNTNDYDECNSVCAPSLPANYTLFANNCTLVYQITQLDGYYAVALQIEDFYTSTSAIPMSSVPIQFLFYGQDYSAQSCTSPPVIIGVRPNLACIGTPIGTLTNETVIAQVGCTGKTITDFTTSSPVGLTKGSIQLMSTGVYSITLLWTPMQTQYGPQGFCAAAVDSSGVQSDPWCITFLVGFTAPDLQPPLLVQGSASPVGTVFSNQSIFSIQSKNGRGVNRPGRNGTYIRFWDAANSTSAVLVYDCGWSPNVIYSGDTMIIYAPYSWSYGHTYYVTLDSGASSGTDFCRAESAAITDPLFWRFDIWDPRHSSTTTTTATPPTTHTITTRPLSTTTPAANLTTTGIAVTTTSTINTTTITTSTTTTLTTTQTTATTTPTTTTVGDVSIITPKDFEEQCQQPVAIATAASMLAILPVHILGMFALFTKLDKIFNPHHIQAAIRHTRRRAMTRRN